MRTRLAYAALAAGLAASPSLASTYVALGDSITFGETDLIYRQSSGDRGYVNDFAGFLGTRSGARPTVVNLAIDGETTGSFVTNAGRTPPVVGRGDAPLQLENLNYAGNAVAQASRFAQTVATQAAIGETVDTITVTLGFNNLAALASLPPATALAAIPATLASYEAEYRGILAGIRGLTPGADLYLLGYFNPFPADPASPAAPIFNTGGVPLNAIIRELATEFGARYVDTASPFLGREAELTFLDEQPSGFVIGGAFGGVEPIGNVHPNEAGYAVIAGQLRAAATVPEPESWAMLAIGFGLAGAGLRRRRGVRAPIG